VHFKSEQPGENARPKADSLALSDHMCQFIRLSKGTYRPVFSCRGRTEADPELDFRDQTDGPEGKAPWVSARFHITSLSAFVTSPFTPLMDMEVNDRSGHYIL
jgi:hypothetical protein